MRVYVVSKHSEQDEFVDRHGECAKPTMELISVHADYDDAKEARDMYCAKNHDDHTFYAIGLWVVDP